MISVNVNYMIGEIDVLLITINLEFSQLFIVF